MKKRRELAIKLDALGPRLLAERPWLGRLYARLLAPRPSLRVFPGWTFGREFFVEHRWMATRRGILWRYALRNELDIWVVLPWHGGTRLEARLGNDESFCVYVAGSFEPNEFAFLDRTLRRRMTFIDVGANDGLFTLFAAARVGRRGRVLAFEPSSRERAVLERNLALNRLRNVDVLPVALANEPGEATLQIAPALHGGHNTLGGFAHKGVAAIATEAVQLETLDAVTARLGIARVDVIKIDVEGAELKVLAGARETLRKWQPVLLIEANDEALRKQGASTADLLALLRSLDYAVFVFSETTGLEEPWAEGSPLSANIVAKALPPSEA
ncbi:MAG: FkbM family methyltransferase [Alphaproteobacteria bacterium]|nr:FkbM family methyltransferase [Alphaproteobacteria bacterium]